MLDWKPICRKLPMKPLHVDFALSASLGSLEMKCSQKCKPLCSEWTRLFSLSRSACNLHTSIFGDWLCAWHAWIPTGLSGIPANLKSWWWMKSIKYHRSPNKFSDLYLCCFSDSWELRPHAVLQSPWTFKTSWGLCPQCLNTRKALGSHERTHGTHAKTRFMMYI